MNKKQLLHAIPLLILGAFLFLNVQFPFSSLRAQPPPGAGPPSGIGNFAPPDANYVVTSPSVLLSDEVLTTELTTDLVADSPGRDIGSEITPWEDIFGVFGRFSQVISGQLSSVGLFTISSGGTNQDISLEPSGTGKVKIGGDSLVVASLSNDPASAENGQVYYNTTSNKFRIFENGEFKDMSSDPASSGTDIVVVDANDKVLGTILNVAANRATVVMNISGEVFPLTVFADRLRGLAEVLYDGPNCTGNTYISSSLRNPFWVLTAIGPPGQTVYLMKADANLVSVQIQSTFFPEEVGRCAFANATQGLEATPLVDLSTLFTPPFRVQ